MLAQGVMLNDTTQLRRIKEEPAPVHKPVARVELENGVGITVLESALPLTIGRSSSCDISIPSGHVSRQHCELYQVNGVLCLKDISSNGTRIENRTIKQESVSIQGRTRILLGGDARITVTPAVATEVQQQQSEDRRSDGDRRQADRRQQSVVVSFERRGDDDRRQTDRRD